MGWEMLPPEQPVWVSRCCPDECVKERDELQLHCESYKAAYDAILSDLKIMEKKLSDLEDERDRLKAVLVKISEWGCNGQCYELVKTLCPCCIAKQALEVDGGKD